MRTRETERKGRDRDRVKGERNGREEGRERREGGGGRRREGDRRQMTSKPVTAQCLISPQENWV